jgi:hypothetical protein
VFGRDRLPAVVQFVDADPFEFVDDPARRVELPPGEFGPAV